jgi:hypothetical protein
LPRTGDIFPETGFPRSWPLPGLFFEQWRKQPSISSPLQSDIDLLVIAVGGRDRYGRTAGDLSEEIAISEGESPFNYSVHVHDPEWLQGRRRIDSFFIQEFVKGTAEFIAAIEQLLSKN